MPRWSEGAGAFFRLLAGGRNGSPGLLAAGAEETPRRAVIGQQRKANCRGRTLWNRLVPAMAVEVGGGESRIGRVDLDAGLPQFAGKLDSEHVQRRLGRVVAHQPDAGEFRLGIAVVR